jgi:hypothetical protein
MILKDENELIDIVNKDILNAEEKNIVFFAGHFPLLYTKERAYEALDEWGTFTNYSLELACRIGKTADENGKDVKFFIMADDANYEKDPRHDGLSDGKKDNLRHNFYCKNNFHSINQDFEKILAQYGFGIDNILRQDQKKIGREHVLYFSEKRLRADRSNIAEGTDCAKSYKALMQYLSGTGEDIYLVSFIPSQCTGNVCTSVLDQGFSLVNSSHLFTRTDTDLLRFTKTKEQIWNGEINGRVYGYMTGFYYRKDIKK